MGEAVPTALVTATFLLITVFTFVSFIDTWSDHSAVSDEASARFLEQLNTSITFDGSISAISANCGAYTGPYTASVTNSGTQSIADFTKMDTLVAYVNITGDPVNTRLTHVTDWSVASITPDNRNANTWDPQEYASIEFNLASAVKLGNRGMLILGTPNGVTGQTYFSCVSTDYYLQNNPTPPTGNTNAQASLPLGPVAPTETTLFNYDQDRDAAAGLQIVNGGSGPGETDATEHQVWRTGALPGDLPVRELDLNFWSGMENFTLGITGSATFHFRDYNGSSHTEIGNVNVFDGDWQGGTGNFVQRTASLTGLNYTIVEGNQLEIEAVVDAAAAGNMWFAYDTTVYPSILQVTP